jgi:peptidyl-dipeptidase A
MRNFLFLAFLVVLCGVTFSQPAYKTEAQQKADAFFQMYDSLYQKMYTVDAEANWIASTDVSELHTGQRIGADTSYSAFQGNAYILDRARELMKQKDQLQPLTVRGLGKVIYGGAHSPGTIPDIINARVEAEAKQSAVLDGFQFCLEKQGEKCVKPVTPNQIEDVLRSSTDLAERKKIWETAKQSGVALKPGLIELQKLRNRIASETGFNSYFALEVSDYGMTVPEMMALTDKMIVDMKPLYQQLHTWAKYKLAERYHQQPPQLIPAHWLTNRWGQAWPGIVEGVDLDPLFKDKSKEWIVQQAERFYVSLGMPQLPQTFWEKSDLYELPADSPRKKNTHATAWHMDLQNDVRSLMSVKPDFEWFQTTHHELGHIYYYLAYSRPEVPLTLREGANRGFHEAVGDLIKIAASQEPYLRSAGILPAGHKIDQTQWLLNQALDEVVFMPWSAGVMTSWEHDFYEDNLPPDQYNKRWWDYVAKFQGIAPPDPRSEEFCDAATKTHINDDPAQYYDYAIAALIKYQLHDYIARKILHQDPHNCNYYGNKEVGKFLLDLLKLGATRDWREVIKEKTGEELSSRAMVAYFQPLMAYLQAQNKGRKIGWE